MTTADDTDPDAADLRLFARYAAGDAAAARAMAERFLPFALRLAARMLGERAEAEDVAQEAMIRLYRAAPGWQPGRARVTTWLYRVTANLVTDRLRRRPVLPIEAAADVDDGAVSPEERLTAAARAAALERALGRLPERQRLAVVLRHVEGLSNPEIATILEVGVEAVESLIARGKRALAAELGGERAALGYGHG